MLVHEGKVLIDTIPPQTSFLISPDKPMPQHMRLTSHRRRAVYEAIISQLNYSCLCCGFVVTVAAEALQKYSQSNLIKNTTPQANEQTNKLTKHLNKQQTTKQLANVPRHSIPSREAGKPATTYL